MLGLCIGICKEAILEESRGAKEKKRAAGLVIGFYNAIT